MATVCYRPFRILKLGVPFLGLTPPKLYATGFSGLNHTYQTPSQRLWFCRPFGAGEEDRPDSGERTGRFALATGSHTSGWGCPAPGGDTTSTRTPILWEVLRPPPEAGRSLSSQGEGAFGATASLAAYTYDGRGEAFSRSPSRRPSYPTGFAG
jgi:hypothetical protein